MRGYLGPAVVTNNPFFVHEKHERKNNTLFLATRLYAVGWDAIPAFLPYASQDACPATACWDCIPAYRPFFSCFSCFSWTKQLPLMFSADTCTHGRISRSVLPSA